GLTFRPCQLEKPREGSLDLFLAPEIFSAVTDAQGIARFPDLPAWASTNSIAFRTDDEERFPRQFVCNRIRHQKPILDVVIPQVVTMSGQAQFEDGTPAAGVTIEVLGSGDDIWLFHGRTKSGSDGRFSLAVPPDEVCLIGTDDGRWAATPLFIVTHK